MAAISKTPSSHLKFGGVVSYGAFLSFFAFLSILKQTTKDVYHLRELTIIHILPLSVWFFNVMAFWSLLVLRDIEERLYDHV